MTNVYSAFYFTQIMLIKSPTAVVCSYTVTQTIAGTSLLTASLYYLRWAQRNSCRDPVCNLCCVFMCIPLHLPNDSNHFFKRNIYKELFTFFLASIILKLFVGVFERITVYLLQYTIIIINSKIQKKRFKIRLSVGSHVCI